MDTAEGFDVHQSVKSYLTWNLPADRLPKSASPGNYALLGCEHRVPAFQLRGRDVQDHFSFSLNVPQRSQSLGVQGHLIHQGPEHGPPSHSLLWQYVSSLISQTLEAPPLGTSAMGPPVLHICLPIQILPSHSGPALVSGSQLMICSPAWSETRSYYGLHPLFQPVPDHILSLFPSKTFFFSLHSNFCVDLLLSLSP
jgi:hypothetical protein